MRTATVTQARHAKDHTRAAATCSPIYFHAISIIHTERIKLFLMHMSPSEIESIAIDIQNAQLMSHFWLRSASAASPGHSGDGGAADDMAHFSPEDRCGSIRLRACAVLCWAARRLKTSPRRDRDDPSGIQVSQSKSCS